MQEIERKWLIKILPNLEKLKKSRCERYIIFFKLKTEIRVQKVNNFYFLERKEDKKNLSSEKYTIDISKEEFEFFKSNIKLEIIRDTYYYQKKPDIKIQVYQKKFKGLERVEVEFLNEKEARNFKPPKWFGKEITNTELSRDKKLVKLERKGFLKILKTIQE